MSKATVFSATHKAKQGGFSLIEVLVSLFVLSIGLLGLAALQVTGLKFNHQSYQRTQATLLGYGIIDRIRANPVGKDNGDYDNVSLGAPGAYNDCTAVTCTPVEMAAYDIGVWKTVLGQQLGASGDAQISTAGQVRTISIRWKEHDVDMRMDIEADLTKTNAI